MKPRKANGVRVSEYEAWSFNEAEAMKPRKVEQHQLVVEVELLASMRPRR